MYKPNKMYLVKAEPKGAALAKFKFPVVFRIVSDDGGISYDVTYDENGKRTVLKDTDTDTTYDTQIEDLRETKLDKPSIVADDTHTDIVVINQNGETATMKIGEIGGKTYSFIVSKPFGNIKEGDTFPENKTLGEIFELLMTETKEPTITNPSLSLSGISGTKEVGSTQTFNLTATANRGSINGLMVNNVWVAGAKQNDRAGDVIKYVIHGVEQVVNTLPVSHITTLGDNSFDSEVYFGDGPQPKNSKGENTLQPYTSSKSKAKLTFTGAYKRFFGPMNIVNNPRELHSMFDNENKKWILDTDVNDRIFHIYIPKNRNLVNVIDLDALNAPIKDNYVYQGVVTVKDAGNNDVEYKHYKMTNDINYSENHRHEIEIE